MILQVTIESKKVHFQGHIQTIVEIKPPKTEKEIRGFLGRIQYISRFIAQLTMTCEPIFRLLKQEVPIVWN